MKKYIKKNWEITLILAFSTILIIAYFSFISNRLTEDVGFGADNISDSHALSDRIFYNNVSCETISHNFMTGFGLGTFIFQIDDYSEDNNRILSLSEHSAKSSLEHWEYQPVHNIYLLITSEIGIIGFIIFCFIITEILSSSVNVIRRIAKARYL